MQQKSPSSIRPYTSGELGSCCIPNSRRWTMTVWSSSNMGATGIQVGTLLVVWGCSIYSSWFSISRPYLLNANALSSHYHNNSKKPHKFANISFENIVVLLLLPLSILELTCNIVQSIGLTGSIAAGLLRKVSSLTEKKNAQRNRPFSFTLLCPDMMPGSPAAIRQVQEEVVWSVKGNTLKITEQKVRKNPVLNAATGTLNNQPWEVTVLEHLWRNKYSL